MRLAVEMAVMEMDGVWSAVAVGKDSAKFHGMLKLNEEAAEIIKLLSEETTVEELEKKFCAKYDESGPEEISQVLEEFLGQLRKEGLLIE